MISKSLDRVCIHERIITKRVNMGSRGEMMCIRRAQGCRERAEELANTTMHEGKKRINLGKTLHDYESTGGSTGRSVRPPPGFPGAYLVRSSRFGTELGVLGGHWTQPCELAQGFVDLVAEE